MTQSKERRRLQFLASMSKEAVACYVDPYKEWDDDERRLLPRFLALVGPGKKVLDLAGGYGKATSYLFGDGNYVVLADMSLASLNGARRDLKQEEPEFVRLDILKELPFTEGGFDGIWFAEAFEYVPPEMRLRFLRSLRRAVKTGGTVFLNAEGLCNGLSLFSYLKNYLYWRLVKRAPIVWGEYIYRLDLPLYKGWHYHALLLNPKVGRLFKEAGFEILESTEFGASEYTAYLLRARSLPSD